jgi:hypothetical protein
MVGFVIRIFITIHGHMNVEKRLNEFPGISYKISILQKISTAKLNTKLSLLYTIRATEQMNALVFTNTFFYTQFFITPTCSDLSSLHSGITKHH